MHTLLMVPGDEHETINCSNLDLYLNRAFWSEIIHTFIFYFT